jgi:hypothetical protein
LSRQLGEHLRLPCHGAAQPVPEQLARGRLGHDEVCVVGADGDAVGEGEAGAEHGDVSCPRVVAHQPPRRVTAENHQQVVTAEVHSEINISPPVEGRQENKGCCSSSDQLPMRVNSFHQGLMYYVLHRSIAVACSDALAAPGQTGPSLLLRTSSWSIYVAAATDAVAVRWLIGGSEPSSIRRGLTS